MAGEQKLTPSGMEKILYQKPGWNYIIDRNFGIINNCLMKVENLLDVSTYGRLNGSILGWKASEAEWYPMTSYTTSSSTTTSTSTTTTSE